MWVGKAEGDSRNGRVLGYQRRVVPQEFYVLLEGQQKGGHASNCEGTSTSIGAPREARSP